MPRQEYIIERQTVSAIIITVIELKIRKIGSAHGVILPKEIMDRLQLTGSDTIAASETPDGLLL